MKNRDVLFFCCWQQRCNHFLLLFPDSAHVSKYSLKNSANLPYRKYLLGTSGLCYLLFKSFTIYYCTVTFIHNYKGLKSRKNLKTCMLPLKNWLLPSDILNLLQKSFIISSLLRALMDSDILYLIFKGLRMF
jgi:hypothetical protein